MPTNRFKIKRQPWQAGNPALGGKELMFDINTMSNHEIPIAVLKSHLTTIEIINRLVTANTKQELPTD